MGEIFREHQPFHRNAIVRWLLPADLLFITVILAALAPRQSPADRVVMLAVWLGVVALNAAIAFAFALTTTVTPEHLVVRFRPFRARRIPLAEVASAEPVRYDPILDAGGWGVRSSKKFGRVYNVSGERGVHVTLADGASLLIGSERPDDLAEAILAAAPPAS